MIAQGRLGGVAEHRRGEQAVVRRQQPLGRFRVDDLEREEDAVRLDDEAHVRVGARPSVDDVALESERQLAEQRAAHGRGRDLLGHDHLLGVLDVAPKVLDPHVLSSLFTVLTSPNAGTRSSAWRVRAATLGRVC